MPKDIEQLKNFTTQELNDLTGKIVAFTEMYCNVKFYPYQRVFAEAIVRDVLAGLANTLTGLFSRQSGKSETVANTAAAMMVLLPKLANLKDDKKYVFPQLYKFRKGLWVGIFAPSNFQSSTTYQRLKSRFTSKDAKLFLNSPEFALDEDDSLTLKYASREYLELSNGSFCYSMSADKQSKIESKTFHLILLDESQDLDEMVVHKSIMPMGAHTNASSVATGTPGTVKGFFYRQIDNNKADGLARKSSKDVQKQLHFEYNYRVVQRYQEDYKKYIRSEKRRIGEDSDEFQMSYNLVWLLERGMAVPPHLFAELSNKKANTHIQYHDEHLIAGLDWGKTSDSTVLTIGKPRWDEVDDRGLAPIDVLAWWERVGDDYEAIFAGIKDRLKHFSVKTLACDATGTGEPLADRLIYELPHITVIPVKFSAQSKDHLYKFFLLMLQEKKVTWPANDRVRSTKYFKNFEHQMLNPQKEYKGQYLSCHAPEDQRNAHDDFPDSLALMMWCISQEAMPMVEVSTEGALYSGRNWKDPRSRNPILQGRW